ncbi:MAG: hypothetical protein V7677_19265 [Motiliproteus sp.]
MKQIFFHSIGSAVMAVTLGFYSPASLADNIPCEALLKELSKWPPGSTASELKLRKAIDPRIRDKLDNVKTRRDFSKSQSRKITALYYDIFISVCESNPSVHTYTAAEQARKDTKALVEEFMHDRH